jgi:hypothetical protein
MRHVRLLAVGLPLLAALVALGIFFWGSSPWRAGASDFETGVLEGTVLWNGAPLDARLATASCGLQVRAQQSSLVSTTAVTTAGSYQFPALQGGTHNLYLASDKSSENTNSSDTPYVAVASGPTASVTVGQTTTQDIDLTPNLSLVTGVVTRNGSPVANPYLDVNYQGLCQAGQADGSFVLLLPPGDYGAAVRPGENQCATARFYFTVPAAGQTVDLGTIAAEPVSGCESGTLQGTLLFQGSPFTPVNNSSSSCGLSLYGEALDYSRVLVSPQGTFSGPTRSWYYNQRGFLLVEIPRIHWSFNPWVVAGLTSTFDIDMTPVAGVATGTITVNGAPLQNGSLQAGDSYNCVRTDQNGNFKFLLPQSNWTVTVRHQDNSIIGTFPLSITNGQTTDIESGTTPAGTNVPVALLGGTSTVGGVWVVFDTVTTAGITTAVVSSSGPAMPSGFLPVGRYYDLSTTATYSGNVQTCIRYDEAQAIGPESALQLRRYSGSAWGDITTSVDTVAHVICGTSTALGTFVVMEPLGGDDDNDGVLDTDDACPTTKGRDDRQGCPAGDANLVELHTVDQAKSGACPGGAGSCKSPIQDAQIRVFDRNNTTFQVAYGTKNPDGSIYDQVFESDIGRVGTCTTGSDGRCTAGEETAGDYLVIVKHADPSGETIYTGKPKSGSDFVDTDGDALGDLAMKDFQVIKVLRKDGAVQFSGGSKTMVSGSHLEIVYPDFAVWEDAAAGYVYPFILTSDSEWTIDVCAYVPSGYAIVGAYDESANLVSDSRCTQTFVTGQTKVVAYEVVDVGSPEPKLDAHLKLKHKGKVKTVDLSVPGIRKGKKHASTGPLAGGFAAVPLALMLPVTIGAAYIGIRRRGG